MGRNNKYLLDDTPTYTRVFRVRTSIAKRLKARPDKTFLLVYALAGHGMQMDGRQIVLINTFDKKTGFYRVWGIEAEIRKYAKNNKNSYVIGLMACCREMHSTKKHSGHFGGSMQQAQVYFDVQVYTGLQAEVARDAAKADAVKKLDSNLRKQFSQIDSIDKLKLEETGKLSLFNPD